MAWSILKAQRLSLKTNRFSKSSAIKSWRPFHSTGKTRMVCMIWHMCTSLLVMMPWVASNLPFFVRTTIGLMLWKPSMRDASSLTMIDWKLVWERWSSHLLSSERNGSLCKTSSSCSFMNTRKQAKSGSRNEHEYRLYGLHSLPWAYGTRLPMTVVKLVKVDTIKLS